MMMYGPIFVYMSIGMYMKVDPMEIPWHVEDNFEEYFETVVVGGFVFGTLMCGVFDVLNILKNLIILEK